MTPLPSYVFWIFLSLHSVPALLFLPDVPGVPEELILFCSLAVNHFLFVQIYLQLSALEQREEVLSILKKVGVPYLTLDLEGFRSGSMDIHVK